MRRPSTRFVVDTQLRGRPRPCQAYTWLEDTATVQSAVHALRGNRGGSESDLGIGWDDTEPWEVLRRRRMWLASNIARWTAGLEMDTPETIAIYPSLPRRMPSDHFAFSAEEQGCLRFVAFRLRLPLSRRLPPDTWDMPSGHLTVIITEVGYDQAVLRVRKFVVWEGWSLGRVFAIALPARTPYLILGGVDSNGRRITCHPQTLVRSSSAVMVHCYPLHFVGTDFQYGFPLSHPPRDPATDYTNILDPGASNGRSRSRSPR